MHIFDGLPDVKLRTQDGMVKIGSLQRIDNQDDRVIIEFAEYIPKLKRGAVVDIYTYYNLKDVISDEKYSEKYPEVVAGAVLVYANKDFDLETGNRFEYIFYK